jgi:RNA polymerase sigma-70 factor (ECF subfamily)
MAADKARRYTRLRDEELMTSVYLGETDAFNELYRRYSKRLSYYFYRMLGNSHEKSQDFLQDIFIKIIERPDLFDASRRFSTWIFSIAHNMCKNEYRRLRVRNVMAHEENMDQYFDDSRMAEEIHLTADQIFREINELCEAERTAFILYYREDFSLREIGQVLEIPEGTVKSKLFYARKKLSQKLRIGI